MFVPPALREGNHMTEKTNVTISTVTTILFLGVLGAFLWFVVSGNKLAKPGVIVLALLRAHQANRRPEYLETGKRVLGAVGRDVKTALTDESDATSPKEVAAAAFYLRAYAEAIR